MTPAATPEALVAMTKAEQAEDEAFALAYTTARGAVDYEHMARVLSGRLRRMDRRAAAANRRSDAAEATLATATAEAASLRAERDRLAGINREICASHNALNIDGARWEARAKAAETEVASLRTENEKLKQEISDARTELDALIQEVLKNG